MKVIRYTQDGTLYCSQSPLPPLRAGEALVRVHAFGLNRADLLQKKGFYPAPEDVEPDILGLEFAGEIIEIAKDPFLDPATQSEIQPVKPFQIGQRVMGIVSGGAYAEYVRVALCTLLPIPSFLSFEQAAALPEAYLTAFDALFNQALCSFNPQDQCKPTVLVHAIGSGVGLAAAHLSTWAHYPLIATTRSLWKKEKAQNRFPHAQVWLSEDGVFLNQDTDSNQVDIILDFIGAAYLKQNLKILKEKGVLVCIGLLGGARGSISLGQLLSKRLTLKGTVLRSRSIQEKAALVHAFQNTVGDALEQKSLDFEPLHAVYSVEQITHAHQELELNQVWSKSVVSWSI